MSAPASARPNDKPNEPPAEFTPAASLTRSSEIGDSVKLFSCETRSPNPDPAMSSTLEILQADIDRFIAHYNHHRPHRSIERRTPHNAYTSRLKAAPNLAATPRYRTRHDTIDTNGRVTIRYRGRLHHIGIGRPRAGTAITMLIADRDIRIIHADTGELIRHLTLDPNRDYQPQNAKH